MTPLKIAVEDRIEELFAYAGARERTPRDRWVSLGVSTVMHLTLFLAAGLAFSQPARYGIEEGLSSLEIDLVAAPAAPAVSAAPVVTAPAVPELTAVEEKAEIVQAVVEPPAPPAERPVPVRSVGTQASPHIGDGSSPVPGLDATTRVSQGGAVTQAMPAYQRNPAPAYPDGARRRGEEGLVLLLVDVDRTGRVSSAVIKQGSGSLDLDRAALKAVKRWRFEPAHIGSLPVESEVEVPIRFTLNEHSTRRS